MDHGQESLIYSASLFPSPQGHIVHTDDAERNAQMEARRHSIGIRAASDVNLPNNGTQV